MKSAHLMLEELEARRLLSAAITPTPLPQETLPDLRMLNLLARPGNFEAGTNFNILPIFDNPAAIDLPDMFTATAALSKDRVFGNEDDIVIFEDVFDPLAAHQIFRAWRQCSIPLDTTSGAYFLAFKVDALDEIAEADEANNTFVSPQPIIGVTHLAGSPFFPPDLIIVDLRFRPGRVEQDSTFELTPFIINNSPGGMPPGATFSVEAHLTRDRVFGNEDDVIVFDDVFDRLGPFGQFFAPVELIIPADAPTGNYFLAFKVDSLDEIDELNELNNLRFSPAANITVVPAGTLPRVLPDLRLPLLSVAPGTYRAGDVLPATLFAINQGLVTTPLDISVTVTAALSQDRVFGNDDDIVVFEESFDPIGPLGRILETVALAIPADTLPGSYFLLGKIDPFQEIEESNEINNNFASRSPIIRVVAPIPQPVPPDLVVPFVSFAPGAFPPGGNFPARIFIANNSLGPVPAGENFFVEARLTRDRLLGNSDDIVVLMQSHGPLPPLGRDFLPVHLIIPTSAPAGAYFLAVTVDSSDLVAERNELNNTFLTNQAAITVAGPPTGGQFRPDLRLLPPTYQPGRYLAGSQGDITVNFNNAGAGGVPAGTPLVITGVISRDRILGNADDLPIFRQEDTSGLNPFTGFTRIVRFTIPVGASVGNYFVGLRIDPDNLIVESNETNNIFVSPTANIEVFF